LHNYICVVRFRWRPLKFRCARKHCNNNELKLFFTGNFRLIDNLLISFPLLSFSRFRISLLAKKTTSRPAKPCYDGHAVRPPATQAYASTTSPGRGATVSPFRRWCTEIDLISSTGEMLDHVDHVNGSNKRSTLSKRSTVWRGCWIPKVSHARSNPSRSDQVLAQSEEDTLILLLSRGNQAKPQTSRFRSTDRKCVARQHICFNLWLEEYAIVLWVTRWNEQNCLRPLMMTASDKLNKILHCSLGEIIIKHSRLMSCDNYV
jgi:hypothetical protein